MESQESKCEENENEESKSEEGDESEFGPLARRPCSTRSGCDASSGRVSYSSSVSTFCRNEIKDKNNKFIIRVSNSIFLFLFLFQARHHFRWKFSQTETP